MFTLTLKSVNAKKLRFVLTGVAVVLGVAFMVGTLVLTDTIKQSYDDVAANVYKDTDAVVRSARHVKGDNDVEEVRGTVDASLLAAVRDVPGVQAAEPQQVGAAVVVGHDGRLVDASPNRSVPIALGWQQTPALNPMTIVSGHAPRAPDDVVIDRATQRKGAFVVGETVHVVGPTGSQPYRLAGVVTYGGADDAAGSQVVAFAPDTAARVLGTPGRYTAIEVVAQPGVSQHELAARIRSAVPGRELEVLTGAEATDESRKAAGASLQFVDMFLLTFAVVALVVGSFVIYNTFSITVAQRTKETALLRAIGATRKQVTRSVLLEAWFTGVFASAVGAVAGIGTAQALRWVLDGFGVSLPATGVVIRPSAIVVSMALGIVVTLVAAYLPARRASKVAPVEALRSVAVEPRDGKRRRTVLGVIATAGGAALVAQGLAGGGAGTVGLGAFAVFLGIAMLGPVVARPFARAIGWPLPRLRGIAGTLARENAARNPRRTSATASALMIGVGLVAMITVFAASARTSVAASIDTAMKGDFIVDTQFGMGGLDPAVAQRIDALAETSAVTPLRYATAAVGGSAKDVTAFDPATVEQTVETQTLHGSMSELGAHDVAVQHDEAVKHGIHVGDTVTLTFPETGAQRMHVVAEYGTKEPFGPYAISLAAFDANQATHVDNDVVVANAPGVSMQQARTAIERVLADYPTAELMTESEFKGSIANQINDILNLVYVLLAMALVIAFFGIANTLALSVFERTRELGLLRAVGSSRAQLRSAIRYESVLIAMLGTALGTAVGLAFSWALVRAMHGQGITQLAIPIGQLAVIVAFAAAAAMVAAALPARRAARLDVLAAITE